MEASRNSLSRWSPLRSGLSDRRVGDRRAIAALLCSRYVLESIILPGVRGLKCVHFALVFCIPESRMRGWWLLSNKEILAINCKLLPRSWRQLRPWPSSSLFLVSSLQLPRPPRKNRMPVRRKMPATKPLSTPRFARCCWTSWSPTEKIIRSLACSRKIFRSWKTASLRSSSFLKLTQHLLTHWR